MKILYVGSQRRDAEAAATALRGIAQNVTVLWAHGLIQAAKWLDENRDLTVLVVDVQIHAGEWPSSLKRLRSLPLRPAVVEVVAEGTRPNLESLGPPADGYVTKGPTFRHDLLVAVARAVTRVRGPQLPPAPVPSAAAGPQQRIDLAPAGSPPGPGQLKKALENVFSPEGVDASEAAEQPADAIAAKSVFGRRLADIETSSRQREQRWSVEGAPAAERQHPLDSRIHLERMSRADLEQKLVDATAALEDARQRHVAATARERLAHELAAAEQLEEQQREFQSRIAEEADKRRALEEMLAQAVSAREETERRYASALSDSTAQSTELVRDPGARPDLESKTVIEQLTKREAELVAQVQHERAVRAALEQAVADAHAALADAQKRHDTELARAAGELAERLAHFDRELSQIAVDRDRFRERLHEAELARDQARHECQSAAVDVERLQQREADLSAQLADLQAVHADLGRQLADATTAVEHGRQREAQLVGRVQHERAMAVALEQAVVDADATLRDTQQRHDAALTAAAREMSEHRSRSNRELSQIAADRDRLRQRLDEAEIVLAQAHREHHFAAAEVDRLTRREADLTAQLATVEAAGRALEGKLAEAGRQMADASECATRERTAAESRQAELEARLAHEIDGRETLERTLNATRSAALEAERWFREEANTLRGQALEREAHFDARLASERLEYESRLAEMQHEHERLDQARAAADADVQRLKTDLSEATHALEETRGEFQATLARLSDEHATALAALRASIAERDDRLKEHAVRHDLSLRTSERARTELRERLQAVLVARRDEIEHVQKELMATVEALEASKHREDVLQTDADRPSEPHRQLDGSRAESHHVFPEGELAVVRHTRDGALVYVNPA